VGFAVTSTTPACNSVINTQPTDFIINLSDPVDPTTVQATDFTVNGTPANSFVLSNGNATITFHFNSSPVTTQGPQTMLIPAGAFNRASDGMPNFEFTCTFCYAVTQLQVTTTIPPVGGTFSPPAPGDYSYDVNFNQAVDPASVQTSDLTLTGNVGGRVTAVQVINGNTTAHFTLHFDNGGSVTASIGAGSITANGCNVNAAFSGMYTVQGPAPCSWAAAANLPSAGTRFVGVFFPANGKFYAMGGRDASNVEFTHPFEYDPVGNTWTIKSATYPDGIVNNMACSVLSDSGTDYIYCVGGSQFSTNAVTGRVFRYDPVADSITVVPTPWPPGVNTLPGGFSVFNNNLFILGGFNNPPFGDSTDQIWEFTPNPAVWVQKSTVLPVALAYIPATTIGSLIYTGGGAIITSGALTDTTNSYVYDPVADSISTIASIPRPTSNTRGLNFCNLMYVVGGQFPTPSNEVDKYDPISNTWLLGIPMLDARRNSAMDTDGSDNIWVAGGYDASGAIVAGMEIFNCPVSPCASPSPTPTPTVTPTATPTATPGRIVLTANVERVNRTLVVHLRWTGATTPYVNIFRNGVRIARVPNQPNTYADTLTVQGIYTYQVCEAGTGNCSNEVRVRFGGQ
jgi:Kelch motif protein